MVGAAVGASTVNAGCFSWFNFINLGCCSPFATFGACHSAFSFCLGFNASCSSAFFSFGWGSPCWWGYPTWYCSPWYWPSYPVYAPPYYAYPSWSYPAYVSYPVYYPVYETEYPTPSVSSARYETHDTTPSSAPQQEMATPQVTSRSASSSLSDRYVSLGDLYFRSGRYDRAADAYRRARTSESQDPNLRFILSDALFAMGSYSAAADEIREALKIDPALVESRADKREFYGVAGDFDSHLAAAVRWLDAHPRDADAWLALGYNRYFGGDLAGAREAFRFAEELGSNDNRRAAQLFLAAIDVRLAESR